MAQSTARSCRVVGDFQVGRQIGSGSFSVVWHGRHTVHGTEVAIKEIVTGKLNKKLQESLMSEIFILKKINHPNIIQLYDIIEKPGKVHLVLEYCKGGDLSIYIQRHGKVPEATAKHFMQQLAAGLQILRDNNLIHRDLKPQNLLLSTSTDNSVLKIADFGFARSLQPRGLAETLCGSPLYMAPEIMQLQKYDAKADLWSVGAILFQLVTGKTPFTGNNQIQLLQNIMKSTELPFSPDDKDVSFDCKDLCQKLLRRNPVERLTFEEFFNHPFLLHKQLDESSRNRRSSRKTDEFPMSECGHVSNTHDSAQEDYLPFRLDDDSSGPDGSPSHPCGRSPVKPTYGFSLEPQADRRDTSSNNYSNMNRTSRYGSTTHKLEYTGPEGHRKDSILKESIKSTDQRPSDIRSKVGDSMELIDQDYVIVSGSPLGSSSTASASNQSHAFGKSGSPTQTSVRINSTTSAPMPITGAASSNFCVGSLGSQGSGGGTSQGSMEIGDALEKPSTNCLTRIKSLQKCAFAIAALVHEKIDNEKQLEAFSIQLVNLAIWKQALHICHTQAASAMEGSPTQESTARWTRSTCNKKLGSPDMQKSLDVNTERRENISTQIERAFLLELGQAEELAKVIDPGSTEMPDAMETIFQSALALGRHGAVEELMGNLDSATLLYSRAVHLLVFLLVEASSLILNPPFSLTNSDRYRLRNYIDVLNNREGYSRSQRMAILKCEDQQCPP